MFKLNWYDSMGMVKSILVISKWLINFFFYWKVIYKEM